MIRVMADSDQLDALHINVGIVATYSDLIHDFAAWAGQHPGKSCVLIDRGLGDPTGQARIFDVERWSLTPADVKGRLEAKKAAGLSGLTVYANRSTMPQVDALNPGGGYYRWFATLDGSLAIPGFTPLETPAAVQAIPAAWTGLHVDLSLVFEDSFYPCPGTSNAYANLGLISSHLHQVAQLADAADQLAHAGQQDLAQLFPQGL